MIFSLGALGIWGEVTSTTALVANGVLDGGVMAMGFSGIMEALQKSEDPKDMSEKAHALCRLARWAKHRALMMRAESEELDKDIDGLKKQTDSFLSTVEVQTLAMQSSIDKWERMFKPILIITILGTVGVVVIFILATVQKGKVLRGKLDDLRTFENNLPPPESPSG